MMHLVGAQVVVAVPGVQREAHARAHAAGTPRPLPRRRLQSSTYASHFCTNFTGLHGQPENGNRDWKRGHMLRRRLQRRWFDLQHEKCFEHVLPTNVLEVIMGFAQPGRLLAALLPPATT